MELILSAIIFLLLAIASALVGEQAKASAPDVARWLVGLAVQRLPEHQRAHYLEEWLSVVEDVRGPLRKIWAALGFLTAVGGVTREEGPQKASKRVLQVESQVGIGRTHIAIDPDVYDYVIRTRNGLQIGEAKRRRRNWTQEDLRNLEHKLLDEAFGKEVDKKDE